MHPAAVPAAAPADTEGRHDTEAGRRQNHTQTRGVKAWGRRGGADGQPLEGASVVEGWASEQVATVGVQQGRFQGSTTEAQAGLGLSVLQAGSAGRPAALLVRRRCSNACWQASVASHYGSGGHGRRRGRKLCRRRRLAVGLLLGKLVQHAQQPGAAGEGRDEGGAHISRGNARGDVCTSTSGNCGTAACARPVVPPCLPQHTRRGPGPHLKIMPTKWAMMVLVHACRGVVGWGGVCVGGVVCVCVCVGVWVGGGGVKQTSRAAG